MEYRREIDGLRAVAVLPVIFFHGGLQGFSGGFVGVDVFFVISGYLITSIILAEKEAGTFTLAGFYERRARRILPALFVVLITCTVLAWFYLLPNQINEFSRSLIAVSIFSSNILFGREANYFATASELNPLLHTWSLAVEEQYYVGFPLFMLLLWSFRKRWLIGFLAIFTACCISLLYAEVRSVTRPEITFYLLKARVWELFIGCLTAFWLSRRVREFSSSAMQRAMSEVASIIGLAMIFYAVFAFDKGARMPSAYGLIPTLGAALIILYATQACTVGKLLSHPWLVGVGLISYSAYLWHQPLFAFARLLSYGNEGVIAALAALALALAYLTWRFVERPFRDRRKLSRRTVAVVSVAMSAVLIGTGVILHSSDGFPERLSKEQQELLAFRSYATTELYRTGKCLLRTDQPVSELSPECDARGDSRLRKLVLWGDSFGAHLYPALRDTPGYAVGQYTSVCPPLLGISFDYGRDCAAVEEMVREKIRSSQPDVIVLSGNWRKHQKYLRNIGATIDELNVLSKGSRIYIIGNLPQWEPSLPEILARSQRTLQRELRLETPLLKELRAIDQVLKEAAASRHVRFVAAIEILCGTTSCLVAVPNGGLLEPIAYDYGHLTKGGSRYLLDSANFLQQ